MKSSINHGQENQAILNQSTTTQSSQKITAEKHCFDLLPKKIIRYADEAFIIVAKLVDNELGIDYYIASFNEADGTVHAYVHEQEKQYWQQLNLKHLLMNPHIESVHLHNEISLICD